jgi:hypothetical protein
MEAMVNIKILKYKMKVAEPITKNKVIKITEQ